MQYLGGKYRQARFIAPILIAESAPNTVYWEPFLGGANIASRVARHFPKAVLTDSHPDLILMWQAAQYGWVPPSEVSEAQYQALRTASSSALRGFVGFGCSYGGKWFGGYARRKLDKKNAHSTGAPSASKAVVAESRLIRNSILLCADYRDIRVRGNWVIYADPPYAGTTRYSTDFNYDEFWGTVRKWVATGATVFVSEYNAPPDAVCIWERTGLQTLSGTNRARHTVEKLFRCGEGENGRHGRPTAYDA